MVFSKKVQLIFSVPDTYFGTMKPHEFQKYLRMQCIEAREKMLESLDRTMASIEAFPD